MPRAKSRIASVTYRIRLRISTARWIIHAFCNGKENHRKILPFWEGVRTSIEHDDSLGPGPPESIPWLNGILIGSAVSAQLTVATNRHTDRQIDTQTTRASVAIGRMLCIGNESAPIQLAQCRFPGWPFPTVKYLYSFQVKYTEAISSNSTRKLLWLEIIKMLTAV